EIKQAAQALKQKIDGADPDTAPPPGDGKADEKGEGKDEGKGDAKGDAKDHQPSKDKEKGPAEPVWLTPLPGELFAANTSWYDAAAAGDTKKRNPGILPVEVVGKTDKERYMQVDALMASVLHYRIVSPKGSTQIAALLPSGGGGAAPAPAQAVGALQGGGV